MAAKVPKTEFSKFDMILLAASVALLLPVSAALPLVNAFNKLFSKFEVVAPLLAAVAFAVFLVSALSMPFNIPELAVPLAAAALAAALAPALFASDPNSFDNFRVPVFNDMALVRTYMARNPPTTSLPPTPTPCSANKGDHVLLLVVLGLLGVNLATFVDMRTPHYRTSPCMRDTHMWLWLQPGSILVKKLVNLLPEVPPQLTV